MYSSTAQPVRLAGVTRREETGYSVVVEAPADIFRELCTMIAERNHDEIPQFLRKYDREPDVIVAFQGLAYLSEYCRCSRKKNLFLVHSSGECDTVMLDLTDLIEFEKQCCQEGCNKDGGSVSCSRCKVATWCSVECLQDHFAKHQLACEMGEKHLLNLNL